MSIDNNVSFNKTPYSDKSNKINIQVDSQSAINTLIIKSSKNQGIFFEAELEGIVIESPAVVTLLFI